MIEQGVVEYEFGELDEVSLAYATSIHKSQGSECPAVAIPLVMQHYMLLERNLIDTTGDTGEETGDEHRPAHGARDGGKEPHRQPEAAQRLSARSVMPDATRECYPLARIGLSFST